MSNYRQMNAQAVLDDLAQRRSGDRIRIVKTLLYKKQQRPEALNEQLSLLLTWAQDTELSRFEQTYALIAATHKASETRHAETLQAVRPRLLDALDWADTVPTRTELRRDGLHLRFSVLTTLMHATLLTDPAGGVGTAEAVLDRLRTINPRKTSHYVFNTTTNILNVVGMALLILPDRLSETAGLTRGLLYHAMRLKFGSELPVLLARPGFATDLGAISPPSYFLKFEESFRKFLLIKSAAAAADTAARSAALAALRDEVIPARTAAQERAFRASLSQIEPLAMGGTVG